MISNLLVSIVICFTAALIYQSPQLSSSRSLFWIGGLSVLAYFATHRLISGIIPSLLKRNLFGRDLSKTSDAKVPEALGVVVGCVVVTCVILLHPFFPHLHMFNAATTALTLTILTGFMDDVLDLRGRTKIMLSFLAALPLIVAYDGPTNVLIPKPFRGYFGDSLELQYFYLVYMLFLAVFFTNGINIYAGVNGLEVGQSVVIAASILVHNIVQLGARDCDQVAILYSASTGLPFLASSLALLYHNWYPSRVFVGDSYTYTAGMSFAVIAILGKISKTVMLFFIPQFINYLMSVPQILGMLPCPRHRLPQYIPKTDKMHFSTYELNGKKYMNLTLINLTLKIFGDMNEQTLCIVLLGIQVMCSIIAFVIRYYLSQLFYA